MYVIGVWGVEARAAQTGNALQDVCAYMRLSGRVVVFAGPDLANIDLFFFLPSGDRSVRGLCADVRGPCAECARMCAVVRAVFSRARGRARN